MFLVNEVNLIMSTIILFPNACLANKCLDVYDFDENLTNLAAEMSVVMREKNGLGLAANQIGCPKRVLLMSRVFFGGGSDRVMVNPILLAASGDVEIEEGCLSLPGVRYAISTRSRDIKIEYRNLDGTVAQIELTNLASVCFQHELDHLNGITMLDRLSPLKASVARRKLAKQKGAK